MSRNNIHALTSTTDTNIRATANEARAGALDLADALIRTMDVAFAEIEALKAEIADMRQTSYTTLLTTSQVEERLGISNTARRGLTSRGELPAIYIDARPRFRLADVEALIARKAAV